VYRFPVERACRIVVNECLAFLHAQPDALAQIIFCCFDDATRHHYEEALAEIE
jgi:O-acetyl-ADP-ribose deacetylase (regulator of RNase III)